MIRAVKAEDLRVGMYVMLGEKAHMLPLFEEEFKISSDKQIINMIDKGVTFVDVDVDQSDVEVPLPDFNPIESVGQELRETIEDASAPPETKAKAVYDHSIKMMKHVIEEPTAENILSGKRVIYDIVDLILADDDMAACLTQITSHDYYTYTHSVNVGMLGILLIKSVFRGSTTHNMQELGAGFFLHDLGKCHVPADLINKPGKLTGEEFEEMKKHPAYGQEILAETNHLTEECGHIIVQHHEREDGSGYPLGLQGYRIHIYARICSIADVYDALTSARAYKEKLPTFEALRIMKEEMITHFHRELFDEFVMLFKP